MPATPLDAGAIARAGEPEERALMAGRRLAAGQLQEERLEVAARLEPRGVDPGDDQRAVDIGGPVRVDPDRQPAVVAGDRGHAALRDEIRQGDPRRVQLGRGHPDADLPFAEQELVDRPLPDQPARGDDPDDVGQLLDLAEDVAGDEHGLAGRGQVPERLAHGHDPGRIEPVGRLVEEQQARDR